MKLSRPTGCMDFLLMVDRISGGTVSPEIFLCCISHFFRSRKMGLGTSNYGVKVCLCVPKRAIEKYSRINSCAGLNFYPE